MGSYWQSFQSLHVCSVSLSLQLKLVLMMWLNQDSKISVISLPPGPTRGMRGENLTNMRACEVQCEGGERGCAILLGADPPCAHVGARSARDGLTTQHGLRLYSYREFQQVDVMTVTFCLQVTSLFHFYLKVHTCAGC
jgi:hypothetical protein